MSKEFPIAFGLGDLSMLCTSKYLFQLLLSYSQCLLRECLAYKANSHVKSHIIGLQPTYTISISDGLSTDLSRIQESFWFFFLA